MKSLWTPHHYVTTYWRVDLPQWWHAHLQSLEVAVHPLVRHVPAWDRGGLEMHQQKGINWKWLCDPIAGGYSSDIQVADPIVSNYSSLADPISHTSKFSKWL